MDIGTAIKLLRKQKGLSQKELGDKCDLSVNALSQIEINASFPHKNTINNICSALGISVAYLLFFSINDEDIPEEKRAVFSSLNQVIKSVLLDE